MPINELYCHRCCLRREVRREGEQLHCTTCNTVLQPPADPEACPRAPDGRHNPYRDQGRWVCSQCLAPVEPPADADYVALGSIHR
jgi:hypothetical protein